MKKTYIMPTTVVTKLAIHHMLCVSGILDKSGTPITNGNDFGTREDNAWDIWGNNSEDDFEE